MPDYTHIEFTKIDPSVKLLADNVLAVPNIKYARDSVFSIEKLNASDVGEPYANITFKVYNGEIVSNESTIRVNLRVDYNILPGATDLSFDIDNNVSFSIGEEIVLNDGSDRIEIISLNESGDLLLGADVIDKGSVIMKRQLSSLVFKSATGSGSPYNEIKYKAARSDLKSTTTNTISFNISKLASVKQLSYVASQNDSFYNRTAVLKLENLQVNKPAKIKVEINLTNAWEPGNKNEINLDLNGYLNKIYTSNQTEEIEFNAGSNGEASLLLTAMFEQIGPVGIDGTIKITLLSVNNNPLLVSSENEVTLTMTNPVDEDTGDGEYDPYEGLPPRHPREQDDPYDPYDPYPQPY